jgi:hypothetical protein
MVADQPVGVAMDAKRPPDGGRFGISSVSGGLLLGIVQEDQRLAAAHRGLECVKDCRIQH